MDKLYIFVLLAMFASGVAQAQSSGTTVAPSDKNIIYIGRWDRSDPAKSSGYWIGSYIRTDFTGTSVSVILGKNNGLDVFIDDQPVQVVVGGPGMVALNNAPLAPGRHTLQVGIKGGGGWQFDGLVLDPGAKTLPPQPRPIIEFIGDSITCACNAPIEAAGNYSSLTALALGCDHTQIAWPGRALMTGSGTDSHDKAGLDNQYFQRNCFYDDNPAPWNFSYTPQAVVINLGQNDGEPGSLFTPDYVQFIKNIRAKFPKAQIALMMTFSGHHNQDIPQVVQQLNASGDVRVHLIDTAGWLIQPDDFSDGVHPNVVGNQKVASHLEPIIAPWITPLKRHRG